MPFINNSEKQALTLRSLKIVKLILAENPEIKQVIDKSNSYDEAKSTLRESINEYLDQNPGAKSYYKDNSSISIDKLSWVDMGILRLLNYLDFEGSSFQDPNRNNEITINSPIRNIYNAAKHGKGNSNKDFFLDFLFLLRQIKGKLKQTLPSTAKVKSWMANYSSGLSDSVVETRKKNKERILRVIIEEISSGEETSQRFFFEDGMTEGEKFQLALKWWNDYYFHLRFAVRSPEKLNKYLDYSLRPTKLEVLNKAYEAGIPFFINPYYLSLIDVEIVPGKSGRDRALRDYVFHSRELVEEFGNIVAWEKEDIIEPGKPNAAGWILPEFHNIHRRYPEVAIFIPDTRGRACGGLCVSCQRMYDFQSGHLNFNLDKLSPKLTWKKKIKVLMKYFEEDPQLRDILITGGDSFMNTEASLQHILDEVYDMAVRKKNANMDRKDGDKYAEIIRVRLGTRLPAFLPQRITKKFVQILADFKKKASKIGIVQTIVQIHVQSAMEVTPEMKKAVSRIISAGWLVANQMVFTAAASRRGHTNKLRKVLNDIGIISYYTFSVKGFRENFHNFATNERSVQEMTEEKIMGKLNPDLVEEMGDLYNDVENIQSKIAQLRKEFNLPFLPTDRNILNLPGVGKSMTYNTIGITNDGRRILEFEHDHNRSHSPAVNDLEKVVIIESKSIAEYLKQMEILGEDINSYKTIWGYSMSSTENSLPVFNYPEFDYGLTGELKNFQHPE